MKLWCGALVLSGLASEALSQDVFTTSTPLSGCTSTCECSDTPDSDSDGVPYDEYCNIPSCMDCSAACYYTDACCTDYLEYCDDNFRILTGFEARVGNCRGTSSVTLGRTTECFGREDTLDGTDYEFDLDTSCIVGCANRAKAGGYDGFAVTWTAGNVASNCPASAEQVECFCSLISGTIGGVISTSAYRCYITATCSDGVANGEETGVDCGGIDCDPCPCSDVDHDGICDDDDSCIKNYFNDADSDGFCAGDTPNNVLQTSTAPLNNPFCAASVDDSFGDDTSICPFSLNSLGQCANDPLAVVDVLTAEECQAECVNDVDCKFFAIPSSIGTDGCECFLYDQCEVYPTLTYSENLNIFRVLETCFDGAKNLDEYTTDCSGMCTPTCSHCDDGEMNYDEVGTDCGGDTCTDLCATFDLVGDGYCLGHDTCSGSFCFDTTDLESDDWECIVGDGSTCFEDASALCTGTHGSETRGFSIETVSDCNCSTKCYYTSDINTFVMDNFLADSADVMECYSIATCSDGVLNGDETDIDCGGSLCTAICDVDKDGVIDDEDSCVNDPENDIDGDLTCRDDSDEECPYRVPVFSTTAAPTYGQSNGMSYCQFTTVDTMCKSTPITDDALSDYASLYAQLFPYGFLPRDMTEVCYSICANVESCAYFSLSPSSSSTPDCQLHETCTYDNLLKIEDAVSYVILENCYDGILNQNEDTTDCGGICEPTCACESCVTHGYAELLSGCSGCTGSVAYSGHTYNETECGQLCEYLGRECEAFEFPGNGRCIVKSGCDLYGVAVEGRRRHLAISSDATLPREPKKAGDDRRNNPKKAGAHTDVEHAHHDNSNGNEMYVPTPEPQNDFPSPSPRQLLSQRRQLAAPAPDDVNYLEDTPAPCNCCYQSYWYQMGPKAGSDVEGGCRICQRDNCYSKTKCYDKSGDVADIQWICPMSSTTLPGVRLTTSPQATTTPVATTAAATTAAATTAVATTAVVTTPRTIDCGDTTAKSGDNSDCALLWQDAMTLIELIQLMFDSGSFLTSLQTDFGTTVSSIDTASLTSSILDFYYSDVDTSTYGDVDGVVTFTAVLSGISNDDLTGRVVMDIRNAIADNTGLPWFSAHIIINPVIATTAPSRIRGRALASSSGIEVGITLPITDAALTTSAAAFSSCMVKLSCDDGLTNGDEDFKDCGGSCAACDPTCSDGTLNSDEEDIDCGGDVCDPCPIDCVAEWSSYGDCSNTCDSGTKTRTWTESVAAQFGGTDCDLSDGDTETAECEDDDLDAVNCPVDCAGSWAAWGDCTRSCGQQGIKTRTYQIDTAAAFGGAACEIEEGTANTASCNTENACPIDCRGDWSNWRCDATCGVSVGGSRSFVVSRRARFGGVDCAVEVDTLETAVCPSDCCGVDCAITLPPAIPRGVLWATVSGGEDNRVLGDYGVVPGGSNNVVQSSYGSIAGGVRNAVVSSFSAIGGGRSNLVAGRFSTIVGGAQNSVLSKDSFAMGHDTYLKNCQTNSAIFGYHADTTTASCTFYSDEQAVCFALSSQHALRDMFRLVSRCFDCICLGR